MKMSIRGWFVVAFCLAGLGVMAAFSVPWARAAEPSAAGQLTEQSLGNLLKAMGLETSKVEQRYDFAFKSNFNEDEWVLSMSAVLSQDGSSVWVMAWLDELPRSAADVPRTALLRLLADNDRLGSGKFFAYIASNRRFVLQRVVPNQNMSTAAFRNVLDDLGASVVATYPHWSVSNWQATPETAPTAQTSRTEGIQGSQPTRAAAGSGAPTQSVINDNKFSDPVRR